MVRHEQPEAGTVIDGKYRLEHALGVGGMGSVFVATQTDLGRRVAVKLLHPHFQRDPEVVERFHREARLAASIGHDNICEVTDFGTSEDGAPYLVMPILKGRSLAELLKGATLDLVRVCDIMRQVLSALDAAHVAGVVHRDLKPDNIFISQVGDRADFVKLLDFGISKMMEPGSVNALTRTGTVMGTPVYMAPEQARGDKSVDHRLDIYAAGVIMYEALTGKRPHDGDSYNEIVFKIIAEAYPPPRKLNPAIPKKLEKIVVKAMAKTPSERFAGAREMADAITKVMTETLSQSQTSSQSQRRPRVTTDVVAISPPVARPRARRTWLLVALLLLVTAGLLGLALLGLRPPAPTVVAVADRSAQPGAGSQAVTARSAVILPAEPSAPLVTVPVMAPAALPAEAERSGARRQEAPAGPSPGRAPAQSDEARAERAPALARVEAGREEMPDPEVSAALLPSQAVDLSQAALPPEATAAPSLALDAPAPPAPRSYDNMIQLKAALSRGEVSRSEYDHHQADIRSRRAAELDQLKRDYAAGKITRETHGQQASRIKAKYETGAGVASASPAPAASPSAPVPAPSAPVALDNMRQLKSALSAGRITRDEYADHQAQIRQRRAAEYERIKGDYRAGRISKAQYNEQIVAARKKYEGE